jgi:hypothetical protein
MIHEIALALKEGLISKARAEELTEAYFAQQSKWWSADFGMNAVAAEPSSPDEN